MNSHVQDIMAELLTATAKHSSKKTFPPPPFLVFSLIHLPLSLFTLYFLTCPLTSDPLLTLFSYLSHSPCCAALSPTQPPSQDLLVGSVFRSESDIGNSWANLQ